MLRAGTDMCDPPPPYTAVDETKVGHLTGQLSGSVSFNPQDGQPFPPGVLSVCTSAPPGYETVAYYPTPSSGDAAVLLQPQQQPQVITIVHQVQSNAEEARPKSLSTEACLWCCIGLCCCCPCVLVSFMWKYVISNVELLAVETLKKYADSTRCKGVSVYLCIICWQHYYAIILSLAD